MPWKQLSTKDVYRTKWMWVTEDEVETETGKKLTYGIAHKHPFALVIPWDGERLTLVGQYRYMVRGFSWELPQGHFEHASIEETAKEELREETGLVAGKIIEIGTFWAAPGGLDQECHIFLATDLVQEERHLEESEEGMEVRSVTLVEFWQMVADGSLRDGATIAACSMAKNLGLL